MIVSPFTPLFFLPDRKADGIDSGYTQTFATTDQILIEIIGGSSESASGAVYDAVTDEKVFDITFLTWAINDDTTLSFATLSPSPGNYYVLISGIGKSEPFRVSEDADDLEETTLIQYSMPNNRQRDDAVFVIDHVPYFFDFRVPGGFKDSNWGFAVDSEQFMTDRSDIIQLYARDSLQQKFTLGNSQGCPVWFASLLNRLLCCKYVYFDGVRFARKDTAVPEQTQMMDGLNSFVFSQNLQRVVNLDPRLEETNRTFMRRVDDTNYRSIDESTNRII